MFDPKVLKILDVYAYVQNILILIFPPLNIIWTCYIVT